MNPKWGYLIPHSGTDYTTTPGDYRPLEIGPVFNTASGREITADGTELPGPYYVFPSQAQGGIYYFSTSFKWKIVKVGNEDWEEVEYKNGYYVDTSDPASPTWGLRVFDRNFEDVPVLLRNQHLIIETRIGEGSDVSFNFIVDDWEEKTESVEFN